MAKVEFHQLISDKGDQGEGVRLPEVEELEDLEVHPSSIAFEAIPHDNTFWAGMVKLVDVLLLRPASI
jgi:hypothetical protein